jgi:hypothetical protein
MPRADVALLDVQSGPKRKRHLPDAGIRAKHNGVVRRMFSKDVSGISSA